MQLREEWNKLGLAMKGHLPYCNLDNILRILENWPPVQNLFWFDKKMRRTVTKDLRNQIREWDEIDDTNLTILLQRKLNLPRLSRADVSKVVRLYARNEANEKDLI